MNPFDDLLQDINGSKDKAAWNVKMIHKIPELPVVDRKTYIVKQCEGKKVLHLGAASGALHEMIKVAALTAYALDIVPMTADNYICYDLEQCHATEMPPITGLELIVAGEILEHITNPGHMLKRIGVTYNCPLLISVPNAFASSGSLSVAKGVEMVNSDHVAYYSYWTLKTLLEKCSYQIQDTGWYNGKPRFAEGLVMLAKPLEK